MSGVGEDSRRRWAFRKGFEERGRRREVQATPSSMPEPRIRGPSPSALFSSGLPRPASRLGFPALTSAADDLSAVEEAGAQAEAEAEAGRRRETHKATPPAKATPPSASGDQWEEPPARRPAQRTIKAASGPKSRQIRPAVRRPKTENPTPSSRPSPPTAPRRRRRRPQDHDMSQTRWAGKRTDMVPEIAAAVGFLSSLLRTRGCVSEQRLKVFSGALQEALTGEHTRPRSRRPLSSSPRDAGRISLAWAGCDGSVGAHPIRDPHSPSPQEGLD